MNLIVKPNLDRTNILIEKIPQNEGTFGQISRCTYINGNSKNVIVKIIDDAGRIGISAIEGVISASLDHPHIIKCSYPPIVHHVSRKIKKSEIPVTEPTKPKFNPFRRKAKIPSPPPSHYDLDEYAPPNYDTDYRRLLIFQEEAKGDLFNYQCVGQEHAVIEIAYQLLNGLFALHNERIIHADVKPSNILYYDTNRISVKLADFTLSSIIRSEGGSGSPGSSSYMAPEILANSKWNEKVDIWSLGCTLYYLYYGKNLVPIQPSNDITDPATRRVRRRKEELKCIVTLFNSSTFSSEVSHITNFKRSSDTRLFEKNMINDLLLSMLRVDPNQRASARQLLESEVFNYHDVIIISYSRYQLEWNKIPEDSRVCIIAMCEKNAELAYSSLELAGRIWGLESLIPTSRLIKSIVSITYRILYNGIIKTDYGSLAADEDIIFNYTGFKLLDIISKD